MTSLIDFYFCIPVGHIIYILLNHPNVSYVVDASSRLGLATQIFGDLGIQILTER